MTPEELAFGKRFERTAAQVTAAELFPGSLIFECPAKAQIDWVVVSADGVLAGFLEVKARRHSASAFDSTIVTWEKHDAGRFNRRYHQAPTICVVLFDDTLGIFSLAEDPDRSKMVGRYGAPPVKHAEYDNTRLTFYPELAQKIYALSGGAPS